MIIKIESTNLLRKLTQYKVLNQEICQRLSLKDLSGILEGNNVEEFEENLLNSVINLCNDQTEAKDEFVKTGIIKSLNKKLNSSANNKINSLIIQLLIKLV